MPEENSPKPITKVYPVAYFQGSYETGMWFYALKTKGRGVDQNSVSLKLDGY